MSVYNELPKKRLFKYKELGTVDPKPMFSHIKQIHCQFLTAVNIFMGLQSCSILYAISSPILLEFNSIYSIGKCGQQSENFHEVPEISFSECPTTKCTKSCSHSF